MYNIFGGKFCNFGPEEMHTPEHMCSFLAEWSLWADLLSVPGARGGLGRRRQGGSPSFVLLPVEHYGQGNGEENGLDSPERPCGTTEVLFPVKPRIWYKTQPRNPFSRSSVEHCFHVSLLLMGSCYCHLLGGQKKGVRTIV